MAITKEMIIGTRVSLFFVTTKEQYRKAVQAQNWATYQACDRRIASFVWKVVNTNTSNTKKARIGANFTNCRSLSKRVGGLAGLILPFL